MAILRNKTQKSYTIVDNYALNDKRLSLKAIGLLVKMLSLPDYWDFSEAGLVAILKDGQSSVRNGLKELESLGYLVRRRVKDESGRFTDCEWEVYETPQLENPNMVSARLEIADNKLLKEETTKQETTKEYAPPAKKPAKHRYGEYGNVLLTDEELAKLQAEFPNDLQDRIDRLGEYIAQKGDKYKSHYATIRAWARQKGELPNQKQSPDPHRQGKYSTENVNARAFERLKEMRERGARKREEEERMRRETC